MNKDKPSKEFIDEVRKQTREADFGLDDEDNEEFAQMLWNGFSKYLGADNED